MRPQSEIDDLLNCFIGQYAGQRPDYYGYTGECLSLAKRWFDVVKNGGLNGQMTAPPSSDGWGSGYWAHAPGSVQELFDVVNYDPNADYPAGSMGVNTATHHIFILVSNNPGQPTATVFEQNADPDGSAAHTAQRNKSRIDGILRLKVAQPAPAAPSVTVTPFASPLQFTVNGNKWNLDQPNFEAIAANPVSGAPSGPVTITAYLTRSDLPQYVYYLEEANVHQGYNKIDCTPYTPPSPYSPPSAPVMAPLAEKVTLVVPCMAFSDATSASLHKGIAITLSAGEYFVIAKNDNAWNLSDNNMKDKQQWINITDNVAPVEPVVVKPAVVSAPLVATVNTPVQATAPEPVKWYWYNENHSPTVFKYNGSQVVPVKDLEGKHETLNLSPGTKGPVSRYAMQNGNVYLIPDAYFNKGQLYGIFENLMTKVAPETPLQRFEEDITEEVDTWSKFLETGFKSASRLITDISPVKVSQATSRIKSTIDGFKAGRKQ